MMREAVMAPARVTHCLHHALVCLVVLVLFACTNEQGATGVPGTSLDNADVVISVIDPDTVTVDTMVTVRITGSGFTDSSTATWLIDTTAAPGITTLSTTFKSASEIEAVILISPDAALRSYNVRIRGKKGKQGIAVEKFRVVAKPTELPSPGKPSQATDINDSGVIVGNWWEDSGEDVAVKWTPVDSGWSYTILGRGTAKAINNAGLIARVFHDPVGRTTRSVIHLPSGAEVDFGPVFVVDISDNGTVIGYTHDTAITQAVVWKQLSPSTWGEPIALPIPAGYDGANVFEINGSGDIVGFPFSIDSGGQSGTVWKYSNGGWQPPERVDAFVPAGASAINDAGALVGYLLPCIDGLPNCYTVPAFWTSAGAGRRLLPTLYNSQGYAYAINNANQIVGAAPVHYITESLQGAPLIWHAVIWFPGSQWPEDLGAIKPSQTGEAVAINNHGWIAGSIRLYRPEQRATVWKLPGTPTIGIPQSASRR